MINSSHPGRSRGPRRSLEEAAAPICHWKASGLSRQAWCNEHGILRSALSSHLHRTKRQAIAALRVKDRLIELQRRPPDTAAQRLVRFALTGSLAIAELTIDGLGAFIHQLPEARP